MKIRLWLMAMAVVLLFSGAAFAQKAGLVIVPLEPVKVDGAVVQEIVQAFSSEFQGYEILPLVSGTPGQEQKPISEVAADQGWDYGAMVRLGMTKVTGTVSFFNRKMVVTARTHIEIATRDRSFFSKELEEKAVGDALPLNTGALYLEALKKTLESFRESFKL
jgi:hypothetical protein